jgi:hypothetical protein
MRWLSASRAMLLAIVLGVAVGAVFPGVDSIGEQLSSQTEEPESLAALGVIAAPATLTPEPTEKPTESPAPLATRGPRVQQQPTRQTPTPTEQPGTVIVVTANPQQTEEPDFDTPEPDHDTPEPRETDHGNGGCCGH